MYNTYMYRYTHTYRRVRGKGRTVTYIYVKERDTTAHLEPLLQQPTPKSKLKNRTRARPESIKKAPFHPIHSGPVLEQGRIRVLSGRPFCRWNT